MPLTAIAFVGCTAVLLVLAFARHPIYGLFAYLLAFYNLPDRRWWGSSVPDLRWSLLAAIVTFAATTVVTRPDGASRRGGLEILRGGRFEGVGGPGVDDANTLAVHLAALGLAFAGFKLFSGGLGLRALALGAIAFIMNATILCNSRGAFVGMGGGALAAFLLAPPRRRKTVLALSALGVGHQGFRALSPNYVPASLLSQNGTRSPHTTVLAVLAEQGVVGIILYLWLLYAVARELFRLRFKRSLEASPPREAGESPGRAEPAEEPARLAGPDLAGIVAATGVGLAIFAIAGVTSNYLKAEGQIWLIGMLAAIDVLTRKNAPEGAPEERPPAAFRRRFDRRRSRAVAVGTGETEAPIAGLARRALPRRASRLRRYRVG